MQMILLYFKENQDDLFYFIQCSDLCKIYIYFINHQNNHFLMIPNRFCIVITVPYQNNENYLSIYFIVVKLMLNMKISDVMPL